MRNATNSASASGQKPRRGDVLELDIGPLDVKGRGTSASAGHTLVLRHALPGSRVRAEVVKRKGGTSEARVLEVLTPSPDALPARCDHFGTCGGCAFQTLDYARQLEELGRLVSEALAGDIARDEPRVDAVVGCEDPWHYRNKMDFTFGSRRWVLPDEDEDADANFGLGLHVPGMHQKVLDIHSCAIQFKEADAILTSVRRLALEQNLTPWDLRSHTGLLRHLVLRKGVNTGDIMVDLVTSEDAHEEVQPYVQALLAAHPEITTLVQNVNTRAATIAVGEWEHVLHGEGVIRERLADLTFTISAGSFFQTNTAQAEKLFEIVREEAACTTDDIVYDLYCGAGAIGLSLARDAREVWGFESVESAVLDARRNATENGIDNTHFVLGDVLHETSVEALAERPAPAVCIVDPPRAGLHPKIVPALVRIGAQRIVYVSCNVQATARDLPFLAMGGYRVTRVRPVDLFPHTPHVECVMTLEKIG